ncbi:MAG: hypothetical protein MJ252_26480 [archaeon]|nr:hypothetical protein [archaeon]
MMANPFVVKKTTVEEVFNNDKDEIALYEKIVELFLEAGYFRARISSLPPFDKVLGGLAWVLTGCFYDIDIEFKDDMTMTEKIRVSEKIVNGLKNVKCPYVINPAQILKLDVKTILPILNFLIKKLLETRDERNEQSRKFSMKYINDKMSLQKDETNKNDDTIIKADLEKLRTGRKFKPKNKLNFEYNEELRVFFDMIEFGLNKEISFQKQLIDLLRKKKLIPTKQGGGGASGAMPRAGEGEEKLSKEEIKALNEIMSGNIEEVTETDKIKASIIESIFTENMGEISNEIEMFEKLKGGDEIDQIKLFMKEKERLEQNKNNIMGQIANYEIDKKEADAKNNKELEEIDRMKREIEQLEQTLKQNLQNKEKIQNKIKEEKINEEKLNFLAEKNQIKEELKSNISKFKKDCLEEKKMYDAQLENYEKKIKKLNDEENVLVFNEIDTNYNTELNNNLQIKKKLFEQNKIINALTRKIQLYPSKLEIIQYMKRFEELYNLINSVSEKSITIMGQCNMKNQVLSLLNTKMQDFMGLKEIYKSLKSKRDKEEFKVTLNNSYNNLAGPIEKSSDKLKEMNMYIESYQTQLGEFQLYELNYMKLIKEYNREYNRYNALRK